MHNKNKYNTAQTGAQTNDAAGTTAKMSTGFTKKATPYKGDATAARITGIGLSVLGWSAPLITKAAALDPPLGDASSDPDLLAAKIINIFLGLLSAAALVIFIYGGFLFMLSSGNSEMVQKGKRTLVWAVIGLAIILSSYGLVGYLFEKLG